jgi:hypothetical protein
MQSTARTIDHSPSAKPDLLLVFRVRAEARADLVANGYMDLQTAVDGLQEAAAAQGLLKQIGQDRVQEIMAAAFARWQYDG